MNELTMYVYKYIERDYLQQFKEKGRVQINNIYRCRNIEKKNIRDPFEGRTKYIIHTEEDTIVLSKEQVNAMTNDYHFSAALKIGPNSWFADFLNVPNAFVFCTSHRLDKELMEEFDCDAWYRINDIKQFTNTVGEELGKQYRLSLTVANKVTYVNSKEIRVTNKNKDSVFRTTPYEKSGSDRIKTIYIEDYFIKPKAFSQQEEFRLIFVPVSQIGKEPVYVECKKLLDYCEFNDQISNVT
jgi:hypothetical protein